MQLSASRLSELEPLGLTYGDGDLEVFVFASPTCPYCRKFDQSIRPELVKNGFKVIYLIIAPGDSPAERTMANNFYCSTNKEFALNGFRFVPTVEKAGEVNGHCQMLVDDMNRLAGHYKIRGTPSIILPDESIIAGVPEFDRFVIKYIESLSRVAGK